MYEPHEPMEKPKKVLLEGWVYVCDRVNDIDATAMFVRSRLDLQTFSEILQAVTSTSVYDNMVVTHVFTGCEMGDLRSLLDVTVDYRALLPFAHHPEIADLIKEGRKRYESYYNAKR